MKIYKIKIREFSDKKPNEKYSFTIDGLTRGWFSLNQVLKFIKQKIQEEK